MKNNIRNTSQKTIIKKNCKIRIKLTLYINYFLDGWTEWGCWTSCSSNCNEPGTRARVRSCSHSDGIGSSSCPCNFNTIGIDTCTWKVAEDDHACYISNTTA